MAQPRQAPTPQAMGASRDTWQAAPRSPHSSATALSMGKGPQASTGPGSSHIADVTFKCAGNLDDTRLAFEVLGRVGAGKPFTGTIQVSLVDEQQNYSTLVTLTLGGLSLASYTPGGEDPGPRVRPWAP